MSRLPRRLRKEPLIEVIWQLQVEGSIPSPTLTELLLGVFYQQLRREKPYSLKRLPAADIPFLILSDDPQLRYAVKYRIEAENDPIVYQVGDITFSLNNRRPYLGWARFREKVLQAAQWIQSSLPEGIALKHTLRYVDFIPQAVMPDLGGLRIAVEMAGERLTQNRLHLSLHFQAAGYAHHLQVFFPMQVQQGEGVSPPGTLIDLATQAPAPLSWEKLETELDALHAASKQVFFEQVLSEEILERLEPEYQTP